MPAPHVLDPGLLVSFEGIEGSGTTTQARILCELLAALDFAVVDARRPSSVRWDGLHEDAPSLPKGAPVQAFDSWLAALEHEAERLLRPAVANGMIAVVDRYFPSALAEYGACDLDIEEALQRCEARLPPPTIAFHLDVPPPVCLERRSERDVSFANADVSAWAIHARAVGARFGGIQRHYLRNIAGTHSVERVSEDVMMTLLDGPLFTAMCRQPGLSSCKLEACEAPNIQACPWIRLFVQPQDRIERVLDVIDDPIHGFQ